MYQECSPEAAVNQAEFVGYSLLLLACEDITSEGNAGTSSAKHGVRLRMAAAGLRLRELALGCQSELVESPPVQRAIALLSALEVWLGGF